MKVAVHLHGLKTKGVTNLFRYAVVAAIALSFFAAGVALGRADVERVDADKAYWTGLTDGEQVVAVRAALDAYAEGWGDGVLAEDGRVADRLADAASASTLPRSLIPVIEDKIVYQKDANGRFTAFAAHPVFSRTFGFYQASITDFYTIHTHVDSVTIGEIVECMSDRPQYSCDSVAKSAIP